MSFFEFFYLGGRIKAEPRSPFANYKANSRWKDFLYKVFVSVLLKNRFYSAKLRNLSWTCHLNWLIEYNGIDPLGLLNPGLKCSRWIFCFCSGRTQTQYKMSRLYTWIERKATRGSSEGSYVCGSPTDTASKERPSPPNCPSSMRRFGTF